MRRSHCEGMVGMCGAEGVMFRSPEDQEGQGERYDPMRSKPFGSGECVTSCLCETTHTHNNKLYLQKGQPPIPHPHPTTVRGSSHPNIPHTRKTGKKM